MSRVAVIDYGMGNLHSVAKALEQVGHGVEVVVTAEPEQILTAGHVVFDKKKSGPFALFILYQPSLIPRSGGKYLARTD